MRWSGLLLFSVCKIALSAELISVPEGITVRALLDWEKAVGLKISLENEVFLPEAKADVAEFSFSRDQLCESHPAYVMVGREKWNKLSSLCVRNDSPSVRFLLLSDTQEFHEEHERTTRLVESLLKKHADIRFVLNAGDLVQQGTENEWRRYREIASRYSSRVPLVPVLGNHEFREDPELAHRARLYATPSTEKNYYTLDYDLFVLVVLDSNIDRMTESAQAAQTQWLEQTLRSHSGRKVLVTYHHPTYSNGIISYLLPKPPLYTRKHWMPLFRRFGVKLIFNGHDHLYQRLRVAGIPILVAGAAGGKLGIRSPIGALKTEKILVNKRTVSVIEVARAGEILVTTFDTRTGQQIDAATY